MATSYHQQFLRSAFITGVALLLAFSTFFVMATPVRASADDVDVQNTQDLEGSSEEQGNLPEGDAAVEPASTPSYTIHFAPNAPLATTDTVSGTMGDKTLGSSEPWQLAASSFALDGYAFSGWNTAADGSGTPFADGAVVSALSDVDGAVVTLFAQWTPLTYTVTFDLNGGLGSIANQTMTFDEAATLSSVAGIDKPECMFVGWQMQGAPGGLYADEAEVKNLMTPVAGAQNTVTLVAVWIEHEQVGVIVTRDGIAENVAEVNLKAGDTSYALAPSGLEGVYIATQGFPSGTYSIYVKRVGDNALRDTGKTLETALGGWGEAPYFTVSVRAGVNIENAWINVKASSPEEGVFVDVCSENGDVIAVVALDGSGVEIDAKAKEGYVFDRWEPVVTIPVTTTVDTPEGESEGVWDPTVRKQKAGIIGTTELVAFGRPATYTVSFDANGGEGTMGSLGCVYDRTDVLPTCTFTRSGYSFTGWNTAADGSGTPYANGASVLNLSTQDKATVKLYAQWLADPVGPGEVIPQTGDNSTSLALLCALLAASLVVIMLACPRRQMH